MVRPGFGPQHIEGTGGNRLVAALATRGNDPDQPSGPVDQGAAAIARLALGRVIEPGEPVAGRRRQDQAPGRGDADPAACKVQADNIERAFGIGGAGAVARVGGDARQYRAVAQARGAQQHQVAGIAARHHLGDEPLAVGQA